METNEIQKSVDQVNGWLTYREGKLLYNLAKNCSGKGVIVEIGSWKGKSTIWLAKGSKAGNNVSIYAIDPHLGSTEHKEWYGNVLTFEEFKKNIKDAKVDDIVIPIVKKSEEAANYFDKPVELIFIDGAHEYELVKLDFESWFPKVIDRGTMAFHDSVGYHWSGPRQVVTASLYKSRNFRNIGFVDSITFGQKTKQISVFNIFNNRCALLFKSSYEFAAGKLHLRKPRIN